jgi:short-subunit dehydrogenase
MNLKHKTVLITGAAHGLGRELANLLNEEGCLLILVDQDPVSLPHAQSRMCDLADLAQRKKIIETLQTETVDILINCAGIGSHSHFKKITVDEVERVMQINTLAPLELTVGLPSAKWVVNIGSVAGEMNLPAMSLYAASKTALHAFTRSIQLEGARALLVIFGPLRGTDFAQSILHPQTGQPNWYRRLDLPVETAARLVVQAMKRDQNQLIAPEWYRIIFLLAKIFQPFLKHFFKRYRRIEA